MEFIVLKTQKIINACSSILMLCPLKNVNENINIFPTEHRLLNTKFYYRIFLHTVLSYCDTLYHTYS